MEIGERRPWQVPARPLRIRRRGVGKARQRMPGGRRRGRAMHPRRRRCQVRRSRLGVSPRAKWKATPGACRAWRE